MRLVLKLASALVLALLAPAAHSSEPRPRSSVEVVFSVPVGDDGLHYAGLVAEQRRWGPSSIAVDADGDLWIADAPARRVLRYSSSGALLQTIKLQRSVRSIDDLVPVDGELAVLDNAASSPRLLRLGTDGAVLEHTTLSLSSSAVTGISRDEHGGLYVDIEGRSRALRVARSGEEAMLYGEDTQSLRLTGESHRLTLDIGTTKRVEPFAHLLGRAVHLGLDDAGNSYVLVELVAMDSAIRVDWVVRRYDANLQLTGMARFPLGEQWVYVENALALSPAGEVFGLVTKPDRVDVVKLHFRSSLADILPAVPAATTAFPTAVVDSCRSRNSMLVVARSYVSNSVSLSSTNISGSCSGRQRPEGLTSSYRGVSYDWGGWDLPSTFNSYMASRRQAGDINSTSESCSRGVDCSGLVSRAWGLLSKASTTSLPSYAARLSSFQVMQPGDIVNLAGSHTAMLGASPNYFYESTVAGAKDGAIYSYRPWSYWNNYRPLRYLQVCGGSSQ